MTTLTDIETAAKAYADSRDLLTAQVGELNDAVVRIKRSRMGAIKRRLRTTASLEATLRELVSAAPELFVAPRTHILHGVKVDFEKGRGGVEFTDAKRTVELIRKHLPTLFETLVITTEKPSKTAVAQLPASDLKRVGATLVGTADHVVVRPVDSEVDKLVDALLKDAVGAEVEAVEGEAA